jgi:hypothetical protein
MSAPTLLFGPVMVIQSLPKPAGRL